MSRVTQALYLTKREQHQNITVGPIEDLEQHDEEINLDEQGTQAKPLSVDETRLEQQINRFKAKTVKPVNKDSNTPKCSTQPILKSALRKNGKSDRKDDKNRNEKDCDVSSSESEIVNSENPVKVSRSNYKKQVASTQNYDDQNSLVQRKRKYESITNTEEAVDSLRKDLSESVVPVSKRSIKRNKKHDHQDSNKMIDIKKARRRMMKNKQKIIENQESSESSDSSSDDTISSNERDVLLSKYFRKIL